MLPESELQERIDTYQQKKLDDYNREKAGGKQESTEQEPEAPSSSRDHTETVLLVILAILFLSVFMFTSGSGGPNDGSCVPSRGSAFCPN